MQSNFGSAGTNSLGTLKKTFGPNQANARMFLYVMPVFALVGIIFTFSGCGRQRAGDAVAFTLGGIVFLLIAAGMFWGYRRQMSAKAELYEQGFLWQDWRGTKTVVRFDSVTAVYEFIGYYQNYRHANQWAYTVHTREGQQVRLNMAVQDVRGLGALVNREVSERLLPKALQAYRSGGTVDFGSFSFNPKGIASGSQVLTWEQVGEIRIGDRGDVHIFAKDRRIPWKTVIYSQIANFPVFRAVAHQLDELIPAASRPVITDPRYQPPAAPSNVQGAGIGDISARLGYDVRDILVQGYTQAQIQQVLDGKMTLEALLKSKPDGRPMQ